MKHLLQAAVLVPKNVPVGFVVSFIFLFVSLFDIIVMTLNENILVLVAKKNAYSVASCCS